MDTIKEILKRYWGYDGFRELQADIINAVLSGKDTLALMPTGGGKSITYQVSALAREGICIVVTPLIALMRDQVEDLKERGISAEAVYTGMASEQMESIINKCIYAGVKFLYISPERLASENFRIKLKQMKVCLFAVDEAHCISQWGYDFRPSYLKIAGIREFFPGVPLLALTATATPEVVKDIQVQLKFAQFHVLSKSFRRDNISYVVRKVNDRLGELLNILLKFRASSIVYVRKRSTAEEITGFLRGKGINADFYHAGLTALQRERKQENWKKGVVPVIVATNAFGMGIDKPDVRIVVHYDVPDGPEAYFQEAGRAGRDGDKAYAVLLYNEAALTALKVRVTKCFPEKTYVKRVYEALGNFFQLGEGEGKGRIFEFNQDAFVENFQLDYARMLSAVKILEVAGYMECTTEINSRSRVCFTVLRDNLYSVSLEYWQERIVEIIMRSYTGIFVRHAFVDEKYIADALEIGQDQVYENLVALAKRKIISYIPGNNRPYMIFHQPRLPLSYITIGREAYEDRKKAYASKVDKMVAYIEEDEMCRQLFLMAYFGQREKEECGACDLCLNRKKSVRGSDKKEIEQRIIRILSEKDTDIKELAGSFGDERELAIDRLRILLDNNVVYYKTSTILSLRTAGNP